MKRCILWYVWGDKNYLNLLKRSVQSAEMACRDQNIDLLLYYSPEIGSAVESLVLGNNIYFREIDFKGRMPQTKTQRLSGRYPAVIDALKEYDQILYLDTDTLLVKSPAESFEYHKESPIVVGRENGVIGNNCHLGVYSDITGVDMNDPAFSSGVWIANRDSIDMLEDVWESAMLDDSNYICGDQHIFCRRVYEYGLLSYFRDHEVQHRMPTIEEKTIVLHFPGGVCYHDEKNRQQYESSKQLSLK